MRYETASFLVYQTRNIYFLFQSKVTDSVLVFLSCITYRIFLVYCPLYKAQPGCPKRAKQEAITTVCDYIFYIRVPFFPLRRMLIERKKRRRKKEEEKKSQRDKKETAKKRETIGHSASSRLLLYDVSRCEMREQQRERKRKMQEIDRLDREDAFGFRMHAISKCFA